MFFYAALEKDKHFLLDSPGTAWDPAGTKPFFYRAVLYRSPAQSGSSSLPGARAASLSRAAGTVPLPGTARAVLFAGALTFSLGSGGALAFSGGRILGAEAVSGAVPRGIAAVGAAL